MPQNDYILNFLNIKDKNIQLDEKPFSEMIIKGKISKIINASLTVKPLKCPHCGGEHLIKHDKISTMIKIPKISEYDACLSLKKQRFLCKSCGKTVVSTSTIVDKYCFISKQTKLAVALKLKEKISAKDIAKQYNISSNTVERVMYSFYPEYTTQKTSLPKCLSFDEFKSVKSAEGAMSFIFCDSETHKIIDIVENRQLSKLREYFTRYSLKVRERVEHIVIDMYSPYFILIKEIFPNAKILVDRFHIVQLVNRAFNKERINIMSSAKNKDISFYNKLKKYWKLLLKDCTKLSYQGKHYHHSFRRYISEKDIIEYLLGKSEDLRVVYDMYQDILFSIRRKNFDNLKRSLEVNRKCQFKYLKTAIKTLMEFLPYIENSLKYSYSNGCIEGINNKIKVIKRVAFGYRSFLNLKNRILLCNNLLHVKTSEENTSEVA